MRTQVLDVLVLAAGAVAVLIRALLTRTALVPALAGAGTAKAGQGRLRQLGWGAALLAIATSVMSSAWDPLAVRGLQPWTLAVPLAAAIVLAVRPRLVPRVVPLALIVLGLLGLAMARHAFTGHFGSYGITEFGQDSLTTELILPQAYGFLLLGGWLVWRSADPVLRLIRVGVTGSAELSLRAALPRLSLLLAALVAGGLLLTGPPGAVAALGLLAGAVVVVRRWPGLSGRAGALSLLALGLGGLAIPPRLHGAIAVVPGGQPVLTEPGVLYGVVAAATPSVTFAVAVQAICLLAIGLWLVPQAFPRVRRLFGMADAAELTSRLAVVTQSRSIAIDSAAADLRRLERDLHDGAQARLVALGMSLRAAERLIPVSPDAAVALVAEARESSVRALHELRELVRGVLPPVLADRGLADAVRALALDSPMQVATDIDLPGRPPGPIETACYFAVAEILTNAAKHSGAREARVGVRHDGSMLRIEVTDFGLGGADPAHGTGLSGVEKRLATFDGIMAVSSPAGGPTIVVLEVPCVLSSVKTSSC